MDLSNVRWRKASRSSEQGDHCIELAAVSGGVAVRDSKNSNGPKLLLRRVDFSRVTEIIKRL
ncbi:DUF397 domain-containing protein [Actinomadura algeriensis]|uniref:DUF397 domain-containing protein n=1 Tax=Actinomadura algeriensis TaxID=1679523 RepID=A0ABR9JTS5_9ACTN|nr:DUF397 domain-containing protein [Actinomadura algeriensis]MBE1533972.1 hypothetical protein [Actinomadura algeriensis]